MISFIDLYEKVRRNFPQVKSVPLTERETLGKAFIEIGRKYGMMIRPCAEGTALARYGADCSGCMTQRTFEAALHRPLRLPRKSQPARSAPAALRRISVPTIPAVTAAYTATPTPAV